MLSSLQHLNSAMLTIADTVGCSHGCPPRSEEVSMHRLRPAIHSQGRPHPTHETSQWRRPICVRVLWQEVPWQDWTWEPQTGAHWRAALYVSRLWPHIPHSCCVAWPLKVRVREESLAALFVYDKPAKLDLCARTFCNIYLPFLIFRICLQI